MFGVGFLGLVLLWLSSHLLLGDIECFVRLLGNTELPLVRLHLVVVLLDGGGLVSGLHHLGALLTLLSLLQMFLQGRIRLQLHQFPLGGLGDGLGLYHLLRDGLLGSVLALRHRGLIEVDGFFPALGLVGLVWVEREVLDFLMEDFLSSLSLGETGSSDISGWLLI